MKFYLFFLFAGFLSLSSYAQLSIMSYNIKYANENDGENSWSQRKEHLGNQVAFYEPDILGVQEALYSQLEYLKSKLEHYEFVGEGRDGKDAGEHSSIFYNTELFELLDHNTFWLSETPDTISKGWDAALNRICTYALLRERSSGNEFWVFNTHFDHIGEEARKQSARLIVDKIKNLNNRNLPVILMGDFNLEPSTEAISYISDFLNDVRRNAGEVSFGPEGTFNAYEFQSLPKGRIDYIFTSKNNVEVLKYGVLTDSKNLKYPSDHFPVMAKISFIKY